MKDDIKKNWLAHTSATEEELNEAIVWLNTKQRENGRYTHAIGLEADKIVKLYVKWYKADMVTYFPAYFREDGTEWKGAFFTQPVPEEQREWYGDTMRTHQIIMQTN